MSAPRAWKRHLVTACMAPVLLSACSPSTSHSPSRSPSPATGCIGEQEATRIWTDVDNKLNAIELDPQHGGTSAVATGNALQLIQQYLQQQLIAQKFTEHEVDRLDQLTIVQAGCNGGTLIVRVTMTLVRDDYIAADGHVDHSDAQVGMTLHVLDTYLHTGGSWKESDFQDLDQSQPSQTPQLLDAPHA